MAEIFYEQAGDNERIKCLKYMLIAKMLQSGHDSGMKTTAETMVLTSTDRED